MMTRAVRNRLIVAALSALAAIVTAFALDVRPTTAASPRDSPVNWVRLSSDGDYFLNYDGEKNLNFNTRDWPVMLIFYNAASVNSVKDLYRAHGDYHRRGGAEYMPYQRRGSTRVRMDSDRGLKTDCTNSLDRHYRVYGGADDTFYDRDYGMFVVATDHYDYGDGHGGDPCSASSKYFGYSEDVAHALAQLAVPYTTVNENAKNLRNAEALHQDANTSGGIHWWQSDGKATLVLMH